MDNPVNHPPVFVEIQHVRQWWIWTLVLIVSLCVFWIFAEQIIFGRPIGNNPAPDGFIWTVTLLVGLGMPLLIYSVKLTAEIRTDRLVIRFFPFWRRTIPNRDIASATPCTYHPILQYGGWGIRYGLGAGMCYTLYGNRGVRLELTTGRKVLIGSQRPDDLAAAISRACGRPLAGSGSL